MIRSFRTRMFGKKPINKALYDPADQHLVEAIQNQLAAAHGAEAAHGVSSDVPPSSTGDATCPLVDRPERDWRWINAFPIPHSQRIIGDE